jgi:hypothetical protein
MILGDPGPLLEWGCSGGSFTPFKDVGLGGHGHQGLRGMETWAVQGPPCLLPAMGFRLDTLFPVPKGCRAGPQEPV